MADAAYLSLNAPQGDSSRPSDSSFLLGRRSFALFAVFAGCVIVLILYLTGVLFSSSSSSLSTPSPPSPPSPSIPRFDANLVSLFSSRLQAGPNFVSSTVLFEDLLNGRLQHSLPSHNDSPQQWADPAFQTFLLTTVQSLANSLLDFNLTHFPSSAPLPDEFQTMILSRVERIAMRYNKILQNYTGSPELYASFPPVPKYWHGMTDEVLFNSSMRSGSVLPDIGFTEVWTSTIPLIMFGPFYLGMTGGLDDCAPRQSVAMNGRVAVFDGLIGYWLVVNQTIPFECNNQFMLSRLSYFAANTSGYFPTFPIPPYPDAAHLRAVALDQLTSVDTPLSQFHRQFLLDNLMDFGESAIEAFLINLARYYSSDRANCLAELACQVLEPEFEILLPVEYRGSRLHHPYIDWIQPVLCLNNTQDMSQLAESIGHLPDGTLIALPSFHFSPPLGSVFRGLLRVIGPNEIYLHQVLTGNVPNVTGEMSEKLPIVRRVNLEDPNDFQYNSTHVSVASLLGKISPNDPPRSMITGLADPAHLPASGSEFTDPFYILANGYFRSIYSTDADIESLRASLLRANILHYSNQCRPPLGN